MSNSSKSIRLDELIETINRGEEAKRELKSEKFRGIQLWAKIDGVPEACSYVHYASPYTLYKEKPYTFEPFYIHRPAQNLWKVELKGGYLRIGCERFNPAYVKEALIFLLNNGGSFHGPDSNGIRLQATRRGIWASNDRVVFWEDADKVLAALIKAGV